MPFMHESLLLDQREQRLTRYEKRLAQQSYEHEKMMSGRPSARSHSPPRRVPSKPYSPPPPPLLPPDPPFRQDSADRWLLLSLNMFSAVQVYNVVCLTWFCKSNNSGQIWPPMFDLETLCCTRTEFNWICLRQCRRLVVCQLEYAIVQCVIWGSTAATSRYTS